eukprot:384736_1
MCTNQENATWMMLASCSSANFIDIPSGMDRNNYIIADCGSSKIKCMHKYNIDTDKWIKMNGFNINKENVPLFSVPALDVKQRILFLLTKDYVIQIQLNNNNISTNKHNNTILISRLQLSQNIVVNNSLFIFGGITNNSILKWKSETKTL